MPTSRSLASVANVPRCAHGLHGWTRPAKDTVCDTYGATVLDRSRMYDVDGDRVLVSTIVDADLEKVRIDVTVYAAHFMLAWRIIPSPPTAHHVATVVLATSGDAADEIAGLWEEDR